MIRWIKRLFCRHEWAVTRWHWTHGFNENHPVFIEVEFKCKKCGKLDYYYPSPVIWHYFMGERHERREDVC